MASIETAAIVISDLVGSTRLETAVGPERADELRREHFDVLRHAIAENGGREVKNTGDGLMVAFTTASAAVACAKAMHQLIDRRNRGADAELHIRIGIGMGEATIEEGDYFGMPSIESARLCALAPDDGILAGELVRMMAARGDREAFKSVGELDLKGIPEPVPAYEIAWEPLGVELSSMALPGPLRTLPGNRGAGRTGRSRAGGRPRAPARRRAGSLPLRRRARRPGGGRGGSRRRAGGRLRAPAGPRRGRARSRPARWGRRSVRRTVDRVLPAAVRPDPGRDRRRHRTRASGGSG